MILIPSWSRLDKLAWEKNWSVRISHPTVSSSETSYYLNSPFPDSYSQNAHSCNANIHVCTQFSGWTMNVYLSCETAPRWCSPLTPNGTLLFKYSVSSTGTQGPAPTYSTTQAEGRCQLPLHSHCSSPIGWPCFPLRTLLRQRVGASYISTVPALLPLTGLCSHCAVTLTVLLRLRVGVRRCQHIKYSLVDTDLHWK